MEELSRSRPLILFVNEFYKQLTLIFVLQTNAVFPELPQDLARSGPCWWACMLCAAGGSPDQWFLGFTIGESGAFACAEALSSVAVRQAGPCFQASRPLFVNSAVVAV